MLTCYSQKNLADFACNKLEGNNGETLKEEETLCNEVEIVIVSVSG